MPCKFTLMCRRDVFPIYKESHQTHHSQLVSEITPIAKFLVRTWIGMKKTQNNIVSFRKELYKKRICRILKQEVQPIASENIWFSRLFVARYCSFVKYT